MNVLISACLLGTPCRYDGKSKQVSGIEQLMGECHLIPVCPEIFGGLATPRTPAERWEGLVVTKDGRDVTAEYERGAMEVLRLARMFDCEDSDRGRWCLCTASGKKWNFSSGGK